MPLPGINFLAPGGLKVYTRSPPTEPFQRSIVNLFRNVRLERRRVELFARRWHEVLLGSRDGAGDEDTRSDFASDGEADQLVAGSRDHRNQRPADAAVAQPVRAVRLRRVVGPAAGETEPAAGSPGDGGEGAGAVSGEAL